MIRFVLPLLLMILCQKSGFGQIRSLFHTANSQKLTARICKGIDTDSAKVDAIYHWVTHKIKYDLKKALNHDYSYRPVKKIMKSRRAICSGYSSIFDELCQHAGIVSATIPGYSKDIHYDLNDKFYLGNHSWNAALIDEEWRLFDACWDAGYIKFYRRNLKSYLIYAITLGRRDYQKYKPRFKKAPAKNYFFKDGQYFKTNHVPENAVWQLVNDGYEVEVCEADSGHYYFKFETGPKLGNDVYKAERLIQLSLPPIEKAIKEGFAYHQFNLKNHFGPGNSLFLISSGLYEQLDKDNKAEAIRLSDSITACLELAIMHFDSNAFLLNQQKGELLLNNALKVSIVKNENQKLISSTRRVENKLKAAKGITKSGRKAASRHIKENKLKVGKLVKSKKFSKARPAVKVKPADSSRIQANITACQQFSDSIFEHTIQRFSAVKSLHALTVLSIQEYGYKSAINSFATGNFINFRRSLEDDLDYFLRKYKDGLMVRKFSDDSLLLYHERGFIVKGLVLEFREAIKDARQLHKTHVALANEFVRLKKACRHAEEISEAYAENLQVYRERVAIINHTVKPYHKEFTLLKKQCKKQRKRTRDERLNYRYEQILESDNARHRGNYIRKRQAALMKMNSKQKAQSRRLMKKTGKVKRKAEGV